MPVTAKETAGRDGKGEDGRARTREVKPGVFFTQDEVDQDGRSSPGDLPGDVLTRQPDPVGACPPAARRHWPGN